MPWLLEPTWEGVEDFLQAHLANLALSGQTLLCVGRCRVDYQGRAESRLPEGDRIVLVKADGALLIHNPTGFKPVNWQPPGCTFAWRRDGAAVILDATRRRPPEHVQVRFERVDALGAVRLEESAPLDLQGSEFDLRDALRERPELVETGFLPWARERWTERGPMDLYGEDAQGRRVVVEVKRVPAGLAEATQLWRYVEAERAKRGVQVRGILVAPAVSQGARSLLKDHGLEYRVLGVNALRERGVPLARRGQAGLASFGTTTIPAEPKQARSPTGRH